MRATDGPDNTGCTPAASTRAAPRSASTSAVFTSVPAVSMMSSTITQVRPSTSPMMFMTSAWFGLVRRLSTIARPADRRLAKARARSTPAGVGRDQHEVGELQAAKLFDQHRRGEQVVHRDVEEPLDLRGVQVHREDARRPPRR